MKPTPLAMTLCAVLLVSGPMGCATAGSSAIERANSQCVASVLIGGVIGAAIGNNVGDGDARTGALIGVAAGGAMCAILQAMATEEDRRQIAALEAEALEAGAFREATYTVNGKTRTVRINASPAEDPAADEAGVDRVCRTMQTDLSVESIGSHAFPDELVCRNPETLAWERVRI